jgi:hypothetical protein
VRGLSAWLPSCLAVVIALLATAVELHRSADAQWRSAGIWAWGLLITDAAAAIAVANTLPLALVGTVVRPVAGALGVVVGGGLGARVLFLLPVPAGRAAATRFVSLRKYGLEQIEKAGMARRARWLIDCVHPAAMSLPDQELQAFVTVLLEDCQRRGSISRETDVRTLMARVMNANGTAREVRVHSAIRLVLDHAGQPMCREIIRRASRARVPRVNHEVLVGRQEIEE